MINRVKEFIDLLNDFAIKENYNMLQFAEDEELLIGITLTCIILDKSKKCSILELKCEIDNLCDTLKDENRWSRVDVYHICKILVRCANNNIEVDYNEMYADSRLGGIKYTLFIKIRMFIMSIYRYDKLGIMRFALDLSETLIQRDTRLISEYRSSNSKILMFKYDGKTFITFDRFDTNQISSVPSREKLDDSLKLCEGVTMKMLRRDLKSMAFTKMLNAVGVGHGENNTFELDDDEYVDYEASCITAIVEQYGTYAHYQNVGRFKLLNVGEVCSNVPEHEGFLFFLSIEQFRELDTFFRKNSIRISAYFDFDKYYLIILENDVIDLIDLIDVDENLSLTDLSLDDILVTGEWISKTNTNKKMESESIMKKVQLTLNGDLAIARQNGDYVFMTKEGKIENVGKSVFDVSVVPMQVSKDDLDIGNIIEADNELMFVRKKNSDSIEVISLDNKVQQIVEEVSVNGGVPIFTKIVNPLDSNSKINETVRMSILSKSGDTVALSQMLNNNKQSAQMDKLTDSVEVLAQAMTVLMKKMTEKKD